MIVWREKLVAFAIHFVATLLLAACAAALIFLVWFPEPFQRMIGGTELFLLVVGCDLALGPLISLVIYNSRKSRRELYIDYSIVVVVQLAALVYGVYVVAESRPAYVVFVKDRFEIATAGAISDKELAAARDPQFAVRPLTGPRFVNVVVPQADYETALFDSLAGNEEFGRPRFYQPFATALPGIRRNAGTIAQLEQKHANASASIEAAVRDVNVPAERLRWLPVRHDKGFWTALVDLDTGLPVGYLDLDPY